MKKTAAIAIKSALAFLILAFMVLFTFPQFFKEKIRLKVEQVINESIQARVSFGDYSIGFFRNFPNLTFSIEKLLVTGVDRFENDTLAASESLSLVFNLSSLLKKTGYEIRSVIINEADIKALVLEDGVANWDIMVETPESELPEEASSSFKVLLDRVEIMNSSVSYVDRESEISTWLGKVSCSLKGDLTGSSTNLEIILRSEELTYAMDGIKYLNKARADSRINMLANLDSMKFYLRDNYLAINDLRVNFAGMVSMPEEDIETDLTFKSEQTSFKSLISLIPAIYLADFNSLNTEGVFNLEGTATGIYSDADSTMPDIKMDLSVRDGLISYPFLPEKIKDINLESNLFFDGTDMDKTVVDVSKFHFELAGNPFDMNFGIRTPISDPEIKSSLAGRIDLTALSNAMPLDSIELSGIIDATLSLAGRMSMIEKSQYDKFQASGNMNINDMNIAILGYPGLRITEAGFKFTPAFASLDKAELILGGKSDLNLSGRLENYIPYIFSDQIIRGNLSLHSKLFDLTDIMSELISDTTGSETSSLAIIRIPDNINFDFDAKIEEFLYNNIIVQNVEGHILVKEGIVNIKETGMDLFGGKMSMNAEYDTRDTLKPVIKADLSITDLGIKDAFNTFNTVKMLAPTAKGINGKIGVKLNYSSLLGKDFMPVLSTITGGGILQSEEVTLIESVVYKNMKEVLKLNSNYSNTFKDLNISFKVNDGRIYISPFSTNVGNIKMNISGDQGIDQTINYSIKTEIPRSDLGNSLNSLIDNLSVQASAFGVTVKPADVMKINLAVSGTFLKPFIKPFFGDTPPVSSGGIKEAAKASVQEAVDEGIVMAKEKISSEADLQADKFIKEAEEKGQQLREEAAKAAEKIRQEADNQSQKLINEAESKGALSKLAAQKASESIKKEADRKADQLIQEADLKADKLVEEANAKREELLVKLK
jgi:hypothetical protein